MVEGWSWLRIFLGEEVVHSAQKNRLDGRCLFLSQRYLNFTTYDVRRTMIYSYQKTITYYR